MSVYSEEVLVEKLSKLTDTQQSVQSIQEFLSELETVRFIFRSGFYFWYDHEILSYFM
jgi:hypothetical protein